MRILLSLMAVLFVLSGCGAGDTAAVEKEEVIQLTFTSWRTEDIERMQRVNDLFHKAHPNIKVNFQPINDTEYDAQMRAGLTTGTGADIIFLRSYDTGRAIYEGGWLADLNDLLPELKDFPTASLKAWATEDGVSYAVPSVGVTHGIYYQKEIFEKYNLSEPETWAEFIEICEVLLAEGETVFAQGAIDDWTLYEIGFSGLGANFYGGEAARQDLIAGRAKLTDPNFVAAFDALDQLQKYLPEGYESLDYVSMQQMFGTGQAAMFLGGSWEIGVFEDLGSDSSKIGWFAPPVVNKGDALQYCFHVDAGIGLNKDSKNFDAALTYLKWTAGLEYAQAFMNELPGFFSYTPGKVSLSNSLSQEMWDARSGAVETVRTVWEKLSAQSPSGNSLMGEALPAMMKDDMTPQEAAEYVQKNLETWYAPFK